MYHKNLIFLHINNKYKKNCKILLMIDKKEKKNQYYLKEKRINSDNILLKDVKSEMLLKNKI